MALTQTGGPGSVSLTALGIYAAVGEATVTGNGSNTVALVAANLTITGNSNLAIDIASVTAASSVTVQDNSNLELTGLGAVSIATTLNIATGSTLTLDSTVAVSALDSINFQDNTGSLVLNNASSAVGLLDKINGFQPGNSLTIDNGSYTTAGSSYDPVSQTLTLIGTGGTQDATLPIALATGLTGPEYFHVTEIGGNAVLTLSADPTGGIAACYCRGTLIATARGEVPVEELAIGDRLLTASGALRELRWIGMRSYGGRFLARNAQMLPVLIKAGALGEGLPRRDLMISPKHAMYLGGALVPAECLVNGESIVVARGLETVEYFHLELDSHDLILAEGAVSESYVEDDNRYTFHNAAEFEARYPGRVRVPASYAAPRVEDGFVLEQVRAEIASRLGHAAKAA